MTVVTLASYIMKNNTGNANHYHLNLSAIDRPFAQLVGCDAINGRHLELVPVAVVPKPALGASELAFGYGRISDEDDTKRSNSDSSLLSFLSASFSARSIRN